jgi:hypothetical protein
MRIVYHLGAHCTDEERLLRCLLKNRAVLATEGIHVPGPMRYRNLLRDTAVALKGKTANVDTQAMVLEQIMEQDHADRLILSWDNFLSYPQWAIRGSLYPNAAERIRAFTQIFPEIEAEFHLSIRNPATFLPDLFKRQKGKSHDEFMEGVEPLRLRWSTMITQVRALNPDVPLTIWCDEDTPLIWPDVLQTVSGHSNSVVLDDSNLLLASIMTGDGMARLTAYLAENPPVSPDIRIGIVAAFLDKFADPSKIEIDLEMPGWTEALVAEMTGIYDADVAQIARLPGLTFLSA